MSGWSDLQNGGPPVDAGPDVTAPAADAAADGSGTTAEASAPVDAGGGVEAGGQIDGAVPIGVACGVGRCDAGDGCCAAFVGTATCQATASGCSAPNVYMACSDSAECVEIVGHIAQCCTQVTGGFPSVGCQLACATGESEVCDPTLAHPTCPGAATCLPNKDLPYFTCQ